MVATPALTVPTTALGDLVRAQYTPSRSRRLTTKAVRMITVLSIVLVAAGAIGATTAHAWIVKDAVSKIVNFCSPNDVVTPSNSFGGLDGAFGLNAFADGNVDAQKTILPDAHGGYADKSIIDANYYRYGFSALKLHSYGTGCGNLVARYIPGLYNIALTLFVYIPIALTMLMVNLALGSTLGTFFSALMSPLFIALSQVMKPIVTILAPFGTLYAFVKYRERVGKVAAAGVYALVCAGFVYWGANGNSGALQKIVNSSDKIVSGAVGTVTSQIADSMFPPVASASKGDNGTSITYGQASGAKNNNSKPAMAINNSLWKGIPLATWSTAQMGPEMTESAAAGDDNAKDWQNRLLNANHIGMSSKDAVDGDGLIMLAGVEAWNSRSYAFDGGDTKTDAWTEGWDSNVDGDVVGQKSTIAWQAIPQLADVGVLCGDNMDKSQKKGWTGGGTSDLQQNKWMFNGSCTPSDSNAAWIDYYKGTSWPETGSIIMTGAMGAILVMIVCLPVAFYVALQKALMYWLLIFSVVFIGIASFGDEKRQRFAKAYFGEFFSSVMKQVGAVAALVILSYMVASIIMSSGIPAIIKPMMILILGSSLWLLALIARKIAKAAIAGDASIVHSTARAPVTAAKTAALAGAAVATGGAALGYAATGATGMQAVATGAKVAKGAIAASGGLKGVALKSAKAILTNPSARGHLPNLLPGRMGQIASKALSASDLVSSAMKPPSKEDKERMSKDPIAQTANYLYESAQGPGRKPTPLGPRATGKQHQALGRTPTTDRKILREHGQAIGYPSSDRTIGTAVSSHSVQSPVNNQRTNEVTGEIVKDTAAQIVRDSKGRIGMPQATQIAQGRFDQSDNQVLTGLSTTESVAPDSAFMNDPENRAAIAAISSGDVNNVPAAAATAFRAKEAEAQWKEMVGSSHEMSSSFQSDLVAVHGSEGNSVAMAAHTSAREAVSNPEAFVGKIFESGVYSDGENVLANIDVRHPASAAMQTALGAATAGDTEGYENALTQVSAAVKQYGVPSAVSEMHAKEGSDLAARSADTFIDAASMAATWQPPENPAEWGDYRTMMKTMEASLSQDAQESSSGKALHNLNRILDNPASTIDDIRVAGGTLVSTVNIEMAPDSPQSKSFEAAGASRNARANDAFTAADYASLPDFKDLKGGFGDL